MIIFKFISGIQTRTRKQQKNSTVTDYIKIAIKDKAIEYFKNPNLQRYMKIIVPEDSKVSQVFFLLYTYLEANDFCISFIPNLILFFCFRIERTFWISDWLKLDYDYCGEEVKTEMIFEYMFKIYSEYDFLKYTM